MFDYTMTNAALSVIKKNTGVRPPAVTSILTKTKMSYETWLDKFNKSYDFEAERDRVMSKAHVAKAVSRGRRVAHALENNGTVEDVATNNVLQEQRRLLSLINVVEHEAPLHYKDLFWGKADAVGIYDGALVIADNKCVNSPLIKGKDGTPRPSTFKDYALQVAAYSHAHNEMFNTKIDTGLLLFVEGDGTAELTTNIIEVDVDFYYEQFMGRVKDYYQREAMVKQRELNFFKKVI